MEGLSYVCTTDNSQQVCQGAFSYANKCLRTKWRIYIPSERLPAHREVFLQGNTRYTYFIYRQYISFAIHRNIRYTIRNGKWLLSPRLKPNLDDKSFIL